MAWMPAALKRALPENLTQAWIRPTQVILHVDAGDAASLYNFWLSSSNLESHFHVPKVNQLEQYMDSTVMADANLTANRRPDGTGAISVETQGYASGEWNPKQQADIVAILVWAHETHGIPLALCPGPDDPGIGWHIMWGAPGAWTPVSKVCPGPDRIKQIPGLIARAIAIVNGTATEDDVSAADVWTTQIPVPKDMQGEYNATQYPAAQVALGANYWALRSYRALERQAAAMKSLSEALVALPANVAAAVAAVTPTAPNGTALDTAALTAAVAKAAADEVAKRLAE